MGKIRHAKRPNRIVALSLLKYLGHNHCWHIIEAQKLAQVECQLLFEGPVTSLDIGLLNPELSLGARRQAILEHHQGIGLVTTHVVPEKTKLKS